jgi:MinD-like ATPase involved in chromosome partitioning or flagellar assembly
MLNTPRPRLLGVIGACSRRGPSVATLNLAIALSQLGKKTTVIDLGQGNLRRMLGLFRNTEGIGEFTAAQRRSLGGYIRPTPVPNLWIVGPGLEPNGAAPFAYRPEQKVRLMRALAAIEGDFVVADLGTELTEHAADFFSLAGSGIVVVSAEASQVVRSYEFLKSVMYRTIMRRLGPRSETARVLAQLSRTTGGARTGTIAQITGLVRHRDPDEARVIDEICDTFAPMLVVDAGESLRDMELGDKLRVICRRYLSIRLEYLGFVYEDAAVDRAFGTQDPIVIRQPNSRAAVAMHRIAHKCIHSKALADAALDPVVTGERRYPLREAAPGAGEPNRLGGMLENLLAGSVQREVSEVEERLSPASKRAGAAVAPASRPAEAASPAGPKARVDESREAKTRRILKTVFQPADVRELEALIDSLDDGVFPDEKWKWKVRALSTPDRVVHHLISRGISRDFFYRELPAPTLQAAAHPATSL